MAAVLSSGEAILLTPSSGSSFYLPSLRLAGQSIPGWIDIMAASANHP